MRTLTEDTTKPLVTPSKAPLSSNLETYSATLRDGRVITIREMTGKDLVYAEEDLGKMSETRKSFHLLERLNVGTDVVSYDELEALGVRDLRLLFELVGKANGDLTDREEDPK